MTFNPDSPKQLGDVLFNRLKLPVVKRTKTGPSTDVEVLDKLAVQHMVPKLVLEYRSLKSGPADVAAFFKPLTQQRFDCLVAFGWAMAEDLAEGRLGR